MNIYPDHIERSSLWAAAAAIVAFAGCTADADIFEINTRPSDCVVFTASVVSEETPSVSRSTASHVEIEAAEWALPAMSDRDATRGALTTLLSGEAGVIGFTYNQGEDKTPLNAVNNNIGFTFNGDELAASGDPIRWNTIGKDSMLVYAYAPKTADGLTADSRYAPALAYTVPDAIADHKDIVVSKWKSPNESYKNKTIHLTFDHALTAVCFKVGFACTVKSVKISGVHNSGTYSFTDDEWTCAGTPTAEYTVDFGETGKIFTADDINKRNNLLTDGENTMILIPQTLPENAKITLVCTDQVLTAPIGGKVWVPGKLVTYTLHSGRAPETVYFDLALADVIINGTSYSGKIHKDGATVDVTGEHKPGNRYYVYQSTPDNIDEIWKDGVFTSPPYGEVKGPDGRPWRDFITNNTNVESVIENWDINHETLVEAAGRSRTNHRIDITGNVTCGLTIDNIYSVYQDSNPTHRTTAGIAFKPKGYDPNVKDAKVTIDMVGDNRVGAVHYANLGDNGNEIIFEGTGSLTVADVDGKMQQGSSNPNSIVGIDKDDEYGYWSNHWSSAIGGNDSDKPEEENSYGIVINSGIIFAGTTKAENCTALGGGGNVYGGVTINGGTVTAVATTTGTAIGGGIGYGSPGGIADVIITGGNVYAYNHANRWKCPSSAIGGGGSINSTAYGVSTVNISGGYIYAESALGPGIGAGSSYTKAGGDIDVNITGGVVIARTLASGSASIGGGTGFSKGGTSSGFNGGYAEITISGNPIIRTGSIGGGGTGDKNGYKGNATIDISGGDIQAQFILAAGTGAGQVPSFTMTGGMIRNSNARSDTTDNEYLYMEHNGGAIYLENGNIDISGGTIKNCTADCGGAVYIEGISDSSSFNMTGGTIQGNTSNSDGGAIYMKGGHVTISGGIIDDNIASGGNGGGIFIQGGSLKMPAGGTAQIHGNSAEAKSVGGNTVGGSGGAVYIHSDENDVTAVIESGTIISNTSDRNGGGICVDMENSDYTAEVAIGTIGGAEDTPDISRNHTLIQGGGLYASGANAHIAINSGTIMDNTVSQYVYNQNVANELGTVTLNGGNVTHNKVTFYSNGGQETEPHIQKIVTSTNSTLVAPVFRRTGYSIVGWNTKPSGKGDSYSDGQTMNINTDIILYAQWAIAVTK